MAGQPYTVVVALNMPESPRNLDLGMFMSCLQVASSDKTTKSGKEEIIRVAEICSSIFLYSCIILSKLIDYFQINHVNRILFSLHASLR